MSYQGIIQRYRRFMPVGQETEIVTLLEGNTPLIPVASFAKAFRIDAEVYVKYEGLNPTGSFKDRGMTMAITKAKEDGARRCDVRIHRQHVGFGGGVRIEGRDEGRRLDPRRQHRPGQVEPSRWCTGRRWSRSAATSTTRSIWCGL